MIPLMIYALVTALVFGWLLNSHLRARNTWDRVPLSMLIGLPIAWLPLFLIWLLCGLAFWAHLIWTRAGGQVSRGLVRRRAAEAALYRNELAEVTRLTMGDVR